ncbi:TonB-dependent receptor plug domain-containing protein [Silvibacterium dinghuense]|uniref:TonB-dependent receptor plug domain-containing protein n=1 Tax=Silvibacterium dinghuense TaxID=1560006 RepID=UPI0013E8FDD9|nr:TonB-dependent receptor plug domain-containing protein [Silvibacterium dinghuense]
MRFQSSVVVSGYEDSSAKPGGATTQYHATSKEIESSAGTYGDLSRYLQLFPGVVFNSDESDDVLVRGGNPIENLYLLDGIEVPNINHIATDATTGGLVSMIDSSAISNVEFLTGGYDASYEDRLSSVISIHSRELSGRQPYDAVDAGFIGAGFISERPFLDNGSILVTAHRSLLNLFTNNIGLSGVPIYTNALSRAEWNPTANDSLSIDSLTGIDSIRITPDRDDPFETNTIDTQYSGWRLTNGIRWRHMYSRDGFGVWTLSNSEQRLNIDQQDQLFDDTLSPGANRDDNPLVPVYSESTHDGMTNLRYDGYQRLASDLAFAFGASGHLYRIAYSVQQPYGEQSPLSTDPTRSDATSFFPHFWTAETGYYGQVTKTFRRWSLDAGGRFQQFSFGDHLTFTPRVGLSYQASERLAFHAGGAEYQQLPPFLELTSYSQNRALKPIKASHFTAGARWNPVRGMGVNLELYQKEYTAYPVSTEYPSLSLANMVDTLGQEFIWIPLVSMGKGYAQGIELSTEMRWADRLELQANAAMALDKFAGLDGIYRRGNFDYPFVLNLAGQTAISKRYAASWRYEYTAGRPYTPFAEAASVQQNRPVYDLNRMNALRGPFYSRLDFKASRMFLFGSRRLSLYGGLENAMDRNNFLGIAWTPRRGDVGLCQKSITYCISDQDQMGIFPDLGAMFVF